jgi:hypothetical protein
MEQKDTTKVLRLETVLWSNFHPAQTDNSNPEG